MTAEILALCQAYFASNYDHLKRECEVAGSEGRELIADVGRVIDFRKEITADELETVMGILSRVDVLSDNTASLAIEGYGYDIHPRDADYPAAKAHHLWALEQDLDAALTALIPKQ